MNRRSIAILAAVLLSFVALQVFAADTYFITTVAGTGKAGYSGDGGPATKATFSFEICDLYVDDSGVLFVVDGYNHRIRKIDLSGTVTTVAGNGIPGYSGDGGPATEASLNYPNGIDFDRVGNLYISEAGNHRIRKVDAFGIITTFAGTGRQGYSGDGGPAIKADLIGGAIHFDNAGNLYVSCGGEGRPAVIRRIDTSGIITTFAGTGKELTSGDGGPATKADLNGPGDFCFDPQGNLYFAEYFGNRIRKIDTAGIISTVAGPKGNGVSKDGLPAIEEWLSRPIAVWVDARGNIFIADTGFCRIRQVDTKGIIWTIAGITGKPGYTGDGGLALEAKLTMPAIVRVVKDGTIYIIDAGNSVIRKLYRP